MFQCGCFQNDQLWAIWLLFWKEGIVHRFIKDKLYGLIMTTINPRRKYSEITPFESTLNEENSSRLNLKISKKERVVNMNAYYMGLAIHIILFTLPQFTLQMLNNYLIFGNMNNFPRFFLFSMSFSLLMVAVIVIDFFASSYQFATFQVFKRLEPSDFIDNTMSKIEKDDYPDEGLLRLL
jgi:hypothetical protein